MQALQQAIPNIVGQCLDNEAPTGDLLVPSTGLRALIQHTSNGLLVYKWGSAEFTNGYQTWAWARCGQPAIEVRLNTESWPPCANAPTAAPSPSPSAVTQPAAAAPAPLPNADPYQRGNGDPNWVTSNALALACQYDSGEVCNFAHDTVIYAPLQANGDNGFTNPAPVLGRTAPIYLDNYFLTAPIDETATVLLHEARHQWDFIGHILMRTTQPQRFCYFTESNAITEMTQFWMWLYSGKPLPQADGFQGQMALQVQMLTSAGGAIDVHSWPAYQRECTQW